MNEKGKKIVGSILMIILLYFAYKIVSSTGNSANDSLGIDNKGLSPFEKLRASESKNVEDDVFQTIISSPAIDKNIIDKRSIEKTKSSRIASAPRAQCTELDKLTGTCSSEESIENNISPVSLTNQKAFESKDTKNYGTLIPTNSKLEDISDLSAWAGISSSSLKSIEGKSSIYHGRVIRAGCRVLAVIIDEMRVFGGEKQTITANVRGGLNGCILPEVTGIRLIGSVSLNSQEKGVQGTIEKCSDISPKRKTTNCKARIKSITGADILEGEIYDKSMWGIVMELGLVSIGAPFIAKLTQTAASASTIWGAEATAKIASSLQFSIDRIAQKAAKSFDGREIRIPENATVIISFDEDVIL